jgi:hypothetical protein
MRAPILALLPVAAGLEWLKIGDSRLKPADVARLAAALPRDIGWLHIGPTWDDFGWAALPATSLVLPRAPADHTLLAGATRLERLTVRDISAAAPAALAAALQALPRLRTLELGTSYYRPFCAPPTGGPAAPSGDIPEASDAFVAAVARLPSLQYLELAGFCIGDEADAALMAAAPRLSWLHLEACGLSAEAAAGLEARLRAAAGRGPMSAPMRPHVDVRAGALPGAGR